MKTVIDLRGQKNLRSVTNFFEVSNNLETSGGAMSPEKKPKKESPKRKNPVTLESLEAAVKWTKRAAVDLERLAAEMRDSGLQTIDVDGAMMPDRAAKLMRIFVLKVGTELARRA